MTKKTTRKASKKSSGPRAKATNTTSAKSTAAKSTSAKSTAANSTSANSAAAKSMAAKSMAANSAAAKSASAKKAPATTGHKPVVGKAAQKAAQKVATKRPATVAPKASTVPSRRSQAAVAVAETSPPVETVVANPSAVAVPVVTLEQRRKMIEEAAYYRALANEGSMPQPRRDWLDAEQAVDAMLRDWAAQAC